MLSATEGKAYAYFPYNAENTSFTGIHLDASRQDDVMYTSTASTGLNDKNAAASFNLQHALAVMKVKVKKGSYTGTGAVTSCSISGDPIGLTGTLDGTTGNLSGVTKGKVSADKSYTISNTATDHDIIFVPTTTAGQVTVGLMMDGKEYTTTTTSSEIFSSNQCYTLNLTVDDSGATLTGIEVGDWTMSG
ncbi:MAG: fimbrillin family protein, partial [Parabacteroides sp.]|nr:fimbrillin family protein [Parabacteroides sp.]